MLLDAVHEHLERPCTVVRKINAAPLVPRSIRCQPGAPDHLCHTRNEPCRAHDGGGRVRRQRGLSAREGPHSPNGQGLHEAFIVVSIFTGIIFVGVEGALILFIVKYRRGKRARTAEGPQVHGSTRLEMIWTVVPVVFLAAIGAFVFYKLPGIKDPPNAQAANSTRILVEGHQFFWQFRYPNGAISIDRWSRRRTRS